MAFHDGGLDPGTADRLLAGRVDPDDAPPGYGEVAQLLQDARSWNGIPDVMDDAVIVAIVDAITSDAITSGERPPKRTRVLRRLVVTKVATVTAVVALTTTGAAAATGSLPDHAQNRLAHAAAHIGIKLPEVANSNAPDATQPDSDESRNDPPETPATADTHEGTPGDDATSPAHTPTADPQPSRPPDPPADAAAPNHGDIVSQTAHDADPSGGKGREVSPVARDNNGAEVRSERADPGPAAHGEDAAPHWHDRFAPDERAPHEQSAPDGARRWKP
jgi:hypothetical protein